MDKLNQLPNKVVKCLRSIREKDIHYQLLVVQIDQLESDFFKTFKEEIRKNKNKRKSLNQKYHHIKNKLKQSVDIAMEKIKLAQDLYDYVHIPTQELQKQTKGIQIKNNRKKLKVELKQPQYCYCGRQSFGEMILCENRFCEKQWFHVQCIGIKVPKGKWYCKNCQ